MMQNIMKIGRVKTGICYEAGTF